ncbi:hypothetical protein POM88_009586 [Heracleum sosnowskyi]|uniref:Uncharacterized protein n=1 Tax=Heracleum sosnowskyi TaxID=360622 RepID=A0AAD8N9N6_9APIA|nr:hypothetical protein POM88_009586 [Heracleum sosnowskyi]
MSLLLSTDRFVLHWKSKDLTSYFDPTIHVLDPRIVKSISQLCLQNWPTPAITWASTPIAHKDAVWAEFKKRYRWADEQGPVISDLFWQKCAARTKDILAKERKKAMHNAEIDHQGHAMEHMHEYSP